MDNLIEAGKIINTHGISGDVKLEVWLDSADFLKKYKRFFIDDTEFRVVRSSIQKSFLIAHLEGIDDIDNAVSLKNKTVYVCKDDVRLPKDRFFILDILGSACIDDSGNQIGFLTEVIDNPTQLVFVINGDREYLVPNVKEFIKSVDVKEKKIVVNLIEGM